MSVPNTEVAWLHFDLNEQRPNNERAFANSGGGLPATTIRGSTDVATGGALFSSVVQFADSGSGNDHVHVAVPLDPRVHPVKSGTVSVRVSDQILTSSNVGSVTSSGSGCEILSNCGCTSMIDALERGSATIATSYADWDVIQSTLGLSDVILRSSSDPNSPSLDAELLADVVDAERVQAAEDKMVEYVQEVAEFRDKKLVYPPSPHLLKPYTTVPGLGYTSVDSILHNQTGLSANQLEALLKAMSKIVFLNEDPESNLDAMVEATRVPSIEPTKWTMHATRMIHLAARISTDYHLDGAVVQEPSGEVVFKDAENWPFSPSRRFFTQADDCDGGGICVSRIAMQIGLSPYGDDRWKADGSFESFDPGFDPSKHVVTAAVRNALSHSHTLLLTVVGASVGEGTKVSAEASARPEKAAGHCVAMLVNSASVLRAMRRGDRLRAALDEGGSSVDALADLKDVDQDKASVVDEARKAALYPPAKLAATGMTEEEQSSWTFEKIATHERASHPNAHTLSLDGTVTNDMRLSYTGELRQQMAALARRENDIASHVGPTVLDRPVDLTSIGEEGTVHAHAFYMHAVEMNVVGALGQSTELTKHSAASHQYVFAPCRQPMKFADACGATCGATPYEIVEDDFALVMLGDGTAETAAAFDTLKQATTMFRMPMRDPHNNPASESEIKNVRACLQQLKALDGELRQRGNVDDIAVSDERNQRTYVEYHVTPRMLMSNPSAISHACERIAAVAAHGQVDFVDMEEVAEGAVMAIVGIMV